MTEILLTRKTAMQPATEPRVRGAEPPAPKPQDDRVGCCVQIPFLREVITRVEQEQGDRRQREARLRRARAEFGLD